MDGRHPCIVVSDAGDVALEPLDDAGREWCAIGPGGEAIGDLREVLAVASGERVDPAWLAVVTDVVQRERGSTGRSALLVKRVSGRWFHATFSQHRGSIARHGLDHRRMAGPGIAGSPTAEAAGVFLGCDLEDARFFAQMGRRRGPTDIWAVDLVDVWLVGDPGADGGGEENWMICPEPIDPAALTLIAGDVDGDPRST